ncbi:DUF732 domain-containing protein [Knoellia sp. S7-12]|uniref:DUF732 domain-containing protein n=1 Tax=Knoellia sp. S7-12 TaxID=3126698 RepID=UPI003369BBAE
MLRMRKPTTLLMGAALALALTACGSESNDSAEGSTPTTTSSASDAATPSGTTPAPKNSGIVPDATWAGVIKKVVPPLANKSDDEVASAAKKICTDFEASPTDASADAILKGLETSLGLDSTQTQIFGSAAVTHFCTPQTDAWTKASIG